MISCDLAHGRGVYTALSSMVVFECGDKVKLSYRFFVN